MERTFKHGSKPITPDARDEQFAHHRLFGATSDMLKSIPKTLNRRPRKIKDQGETNFCTAFATSTASEFQEGIELSPEWQAAKIGYVSGAPITDGADPRMALKTAQTFGSLPQDMAGYSLADKSEYFLAEWQNWPAPLDLLADPHEKQSYFNIHTGPFDPFDNIKLALALANKDNGVGIAFTQWQGDMWNDAQHGFVDKFDNSRVSGFHAYVYLDYETTLQGTEVIVVQNSCGVGYGDGGLQRFTREVVNAIYTQEPLGSAAYIFRDLSPATVAQLNRPLMGPLLRYLRQFFPNIV